MLRALTVVAITWMAGCVGLKDDETGTTTGGATGGQTGGGQGGGSDGGPTGGGPTGGPSIAQIPDRRPDDEFTTTIDNVVVALKRWLSVLDLQVKHEP